MFSNSATYRTRHNLCEIRQMPIITALFKTNYQPFLRIEPLVLKTVSNGIGLYLKSKRY